MAELNLIRIDTEKGMLDAIEEIDEEYESVTFFPNNREMRITLTDEQVERGIDKKWEDIIILWSNTGIISSTCRWGDKRIKPRYNP